MFKPIRILKFINCSNKSKYLVGAQRFSIHRRGIFRLSAVAFPPGPVTKPAAAVTKHYFPRYCGFILIFVNFVAFPCNCMPFGGSAIVRSLSDGKRLGLGNNTVISRVTKPNLGQLHFSDSSDQLPLI